MTPNSDSLFNVIKFISSSTVESDSLSTLFTFLVELQHLAKCPFSLHDLQIKPPAGHDDCDWENNPCRKNSMLSDYWFFFWFFENSDFRILMYNSDFSARFILFCKFFVLTDSVGSCLTLNGLFVF